MDIAIGGLILFILLFPGISFNKGYYSGEFSRKYLSTDFLGIFVNTIFPSLILYFLAFLVIFPFGYYYDIKVLLGIISSNDNLVEASITKFDNYIIEIAIFQLILNVFAYFSGKGARNLILKFSIDTELDSFRFDNI